MADVSSYEVSLEFEQGSFTLVTDDVLQVEISRGLSDMIGGISVGECNVELNNQGGKYSHGSLAGQIKPNIGIAVKATHSGSERALFVGYVDEYSMSPSLSQPRNLLVSARDAWKILMSRTITTSLRIDTDIGSLYTEVLSLSGVNSFHVGESGRNIPFFHLRETRFEDGIQELLGLTHAYSFVCPLRCFRIENRHFDQVASVADSFQDSGKCVGMNWTLNDDETFNKIIVETVPRKKATTITSIAGLEAPVTLPPSAHTFLEVNYIDPDTREPVPATDIQAITTDDWRASGTPEGEVDKTSTTSISTIFYGATAVNTIYNGDGQIAYLTKFTPRGKPISRLSEASVTLESSASQELYTELEFTHSSDQIGSVNDANDLATFLRNQYAFPFPLVTVGYRNDFPRILDRQVGDRVTVVSSFLSVNSEFIIRRVDHVIDAEAGWIHDATFEVDISRGFDGLILDDAELGILDGTRTAAY